MSCRAYADLAGHAPRGRVRRAGGGEGGERGGARGEGGGEVRVRGGREPAGVEAVEWAVRLQELGAGEILLTSMDADGTRNGYDLPLTQAVARAVRVPVIASGGAGKLEHLAGALDVGAHGVLAATLFHYRGTTLPEARAYLASRGYPVRP